MDIQKSKLKFTIANRWFPPDNQGGIAMYNGFLVHLIKHKYDLNLVSLKAPANQDYYKGLKIPYYPINATLPTVVTRFARTNWLKNGLRAWQDQKIASAFSNHLTDHLPHIIEFMDIHSESYVFLKQNPMAKRKVKIIIRSHTPWGVLRPTAHPDDIKGVDSWGAISREHFCFHACDAITTPSQDLKEQLVKIYALPENKITVIPNIVDTNHFCPLASEKNEEFTFLHVGRFERAKGVITMIKAFIELAKDNSHIKLVNVGRPRGKALDECRNLLSKAGIKEKVSFTGFVPYENLPDYYAKADAVIVPPEIYESFSYTAAQAISCGKPVIVSNSGGIPETVQHGKFGSIFPKGDFLALAEKMKSVSSGPGVDSNASHLYAKNTFGMDKLADTFLNFYANIYNS